MRVFLRANLTQPSLCCSPRVPVETWKLYEDVALVDGSVPAIGQYMSSITGLEPAVWFKALVVDTVCVDFISNSIQWTTCRHISCSERSMADRLYQRCKHTHECLLNEDFYLPDVDLERGLDLAKQILVRRDQEEDVDLLHLLHVYILPIISLHSEDKEHVTQALTKQKMVLGKLDSQIDEMSCQRTKIKENMRRWREDICKELQTENAIVSCNTSFLKLLCQHLEADIRNSYVELDTCQKKVEEAKLKVKRKEGRHYVSQLKNARTARDEVANRITKSLYVIEEVGMMIRISKAPDKQELSDMHQAYIRIQADWEGHTKELRELQRKKICATSVREALVSTESELAQGVESVGIEISSDGAKRPTDVLGEASLPAGWETLQSQVLKSLEFNPTVQRLHNEFIGWIRRYYASELDKQQSNSSWKGKLPVCGQCTQVEESADVTCLRISPDHFSRIRESIREKKPTTHYQGLTMTLRNEIFGHFQEVVDQLVKDAAVPSTCFSRLWTCYERCFFSTKCRDLLRLYKRAYAISTRKLERLLPTVTIRDLELDDEWILNILGLYAPNFVSRLSEEVTETAPEIGQLAEELDKELGKEEREVKETEGKNVDSETESIRERVESGISILEVDGVKMRQQGSKRRDVDQRSSNRYTRIIDLMWVTNPPPHRKASERSSTWSGLEYEARNSRGDGTSDNLSTSVPNFNSDSVVRAGHSDPIPVPQNTNSNARTLASPISDSGVCLNIPKDADFAAGDSKDIFEPVQMENSMADSSDPLGKRCQDNPNTKVFLRRFQTAYHCFRVVLQDTVPMAKLQWLYRCLQEVNTTAEKQSELISCGKRRMLGGDDLLTALILFLLHGDVQEVASGYHHIMLLQDYLPDFLDKGYFGFTVNQFLLAYSFLLKYEENEMVPGPE